MAIEQHPIPQDVAGYKFRLVGEMTLQQFIWLAVGIIIALIIYSSPLPFFFKWPLATIFACLGAGIAFVPVEGRPLDKWLIAFIKSIYAPTIFVWQKLDDKEIESTMHGTSQSSEAKVQGTETLSLTKGEPEGVSVQAISSQNEPVAAKGSVSIPAEPTPQPLPLTTKEKTEETPPSANPDVPTSPSINAQSEMKNVQSATHDTRLPIPFTPTTPNTLVGMTLTPEGKILEGTLVEIRQGGITIRATKSNQLGQFLFAKPLEPGTIQIISEKPGFEFDTYALTLTNQIIKPLRLQAKSKTV